MYLQNEHNISGYPSYHTGYETFEMMDEFIDPDYKIHQACGRVGGLATLYLADSLLLPFDVRKIPEAMREVIQSLKKVKLDDKLRIISPSFGKRKSLRYLKVLIFIKTFRIYKKNL